MTAQTARVVPISRLLLVEPAVESAASAGKDPGQQRRLRQSEGALDFASWQVLAFVELDLAAGPAHHEQPAAGLCVEIVRLAAHPVSLRGLSFDELDPGLPHEDDIRGVAAQGDLIADAAGRRVAGAQRLSASNRSYRFQMPLSYTSVVAVPSASFR